MGGRALATQRKEATMIRYSVVIPERDSGTEVPRQLPRLCEVLDRLTLPYEVVVVDDKYAVKISELNPQVG